MMKKLVWTLALLAIVGGGAYYYFSHRNRPEPPQVIQATITRGDITEYVQATGTLEAQRTVQVGPQVSGTITELGADFNSIVRAGQVVARLDPSLLQTQVAIQEANVERQQTDIESQRVQLEDAKRTAARTKELFDRGLANQTQLEQAELTVKTREAQIASAEKQLVQVRANLEQARLNVSYTEVKSPIDGVVVNRRVDIGQTVQSSMNITAFFDIAYDLRNLRLTAGVDEAEIGKIRQGMAVTFTVDTYEGRVFRGQVDTVRLNATTQNNVVTYPVWITVPNPDLALKPGLTATIRIVLSTATDVLRIPNQALRFRPTNDMFTALGLTPPAPPAGRGAAQGRGGPSDAAVPATVGPGQPTAAAAPTSQQAAARPPAAPAAAAAQPGAAQVQGQRGQGRGNRPDFASMSPEERQRFMEMAGRAGGPGRNGRGGQWTNASVTTPVAPRPPLTGGGDQRLDELLPPVERRVSPGQVWKWDETAKTLTPVRVTTGVTDGQYSELISGDLEVDQQVVTNIAIPMTAAQRNQQQQSIFGQQQGRGFGGPQPGGGGAGAGRGGGGRGGF